MKKRTLFFTLAALSGVIVGLLFAAKLDFLPKLESQVVKQEAPLPLENLKLEDAVISVANTAGKAVVSISTEHVQKMRGARRYYFGSPFGESPFGQDDPFQRFFDDFFEQIPDRDFKQMGLGSGVIIDPEGYILTNEHVISQADKITVKLPDGREFKGEVKGRDSRADLAVIKIEARNLPVANLGDSDNLKIGQWIVAIGNPFGFALENPEPTVTAGVISALHRSLGRVISREKDYSDVIQTDAAINPGNSGGPLVNLKGEVVGINVAIFSTSGGYQGIGFAIPINSAKRILPRLIEGKKILYGWLGVTVQDLTDDLAKYFGLPDKDGILVAKVLENSPAQKAGMRENDVLKQFDSKAIHNVKDLLSTVAKAEVGRKVKVVLMREKKELALEVTIGERPQNLEEEASSFVSSAYSWRGLEVEDLSPPKSRHYRIEEKEGALVVNVGPNSLAERGGLIPGDIILKLNKQEVKNKADYEGITKALKGDCLITTARGIFLIKESE